MSENHGRLDQAGRAGEAFDPGRYVRSIKTKNGPADYLDVKWRLVWFRSEHPDGVIDSQHIVIDDKLAVFRVAVSLPAGGIATGYGSETPGDFRDYIEKAETKALGRALAALGYGTQFADDFDGKDAPLADSPVESPARTTQERSGQAEPSVDQASQEADWMSAIEAASTVAEAAEIATKVRKQYPRDSRVVQAAIKRIAALKSMPS